MDTIFFYALLVFCLAVFCVMFFDASHGEESFESNWGEPVPKTLLVHRWWRHLLGARAGLAVLAAAIGVVLLSLR